MTLEQSIKSGRNFRRPCFKPYGTHTTWLKSIDNKIVFVSTGENWTPRTEDIFANDWVLEEIKRELSFDEIFKAVKKVTETSYTELAFERELKIALGFSTQPKLPSWDNEF